MSARRRRGMTLVEVLVALTVLATALTTLSRLVGASVSSVTDDTRLTQAMWLAQSLLTEAELAPPEPGRVEGDLAARGPAGVGLRYEREVLRTPHPGLREVHVRVFWAAGRRNGCELVELIRVPTA